MIDSLPHQIDDEDGGDAGSGYPMTVLVVVSVAVQTGLERMAATCPQLHYVEPGLRDSYLLTPT